MVYRTRTYLAGDWTGDKNAIDQLQNGMTASIGDSILLTHTIYINHTMEVRIAPLKKVFV